MYLMKIFDIGENDCVGNSNSSFCQNEVNSYYVNFYSKKTKIANNQNFNRMRSLG